MVFRMQCFEIPKQRVLADWSCSASTVLQGST